jgi:putative MATE family efflux protein
MGLMAYVMWLLPSLFSFVYIGGTALVARMVGAGELKKASHATTQALLLGAAGSVLGIGLTILLAPSFVHAMQLRGHAAELALRYIGIVTWAIPGIMLEYVGTACLRGAGDAVTGLLARVFVNVMNNVLSIGLVTGAGPFPEMGWDGLAMGTAIGYWCGGLIILAMLVRGRAGLRIGLFQRSEWRPDVTLMRRILSVGFPGGVDVLTIIACHLAYAAIINSLGTLAQAAHGLGVQIEALSYLPGSAFQVAAATLAGQALGAGDDRRAIRGVLTSLAFAVCIMTTASIVFFTLGEHLAMVFTGEPTPVTELTGRLLKIVALSGPSLALLMVLTGALRGSGDTAWPLAITLVSLVGVRLPLACLLAWDDVTLPLVDVVLPAAGLGVIGAWYAMVTEVIVRSTLVGLRFLHGGWRKVTV